MTTKRIALVVEGPTEKRFFVALGAWYTELGLDVDITPSKGRSQLIKDAAKHCRVHRRKGRELIVFLLDQDADECPPATAAMLDNVRSNNDVLVCVVARQLEAWYLADPLAIVDATGQNYQCRSKTDSLPDSFDAIRSIFYRERRQYLTKMEITRAIADRFDLNRAAANNNSAMRFKSKLIDRARDP